MRKDSLDALGGHFEALSKLLSADHTHGPTPQRIVRTAQAALGAEHAGLTLLRPRQAPRSLAQTSSVVIDVDALQYKLQEGPCWEAAEGDDLARADDLARESRWGAFGPRCVAETSIRSMLAVQLRLDGEGRGAMNFYASTPRAFTDEDEAVAVMFAPFAAIALRAQLEARRADQLSQALENSRQIGIAMGILMARDLVDEAEAFGRLVEASQRLNRKLSLIAQDVKLTGELP